MGRWTQYDEDEYRLPEGMERVGYDSDTGRYIFRDSDGIMYKGPEGSMFGELMRMDGGSASTLDEAHEGDLEAAPGRSDGYQPLATDTNNRARNINNLTSAYRTLFPFFLIIAVVLLLIWRLILAPGTSPQPPCPKGTDLYWVQPGDSCWEISRAHGVTLENLMRANPKLVCDPLLPGSTVCLPQATTKTPSRKRL
jgi:LysM repeat protein